MATSSPDPRRILTPLQWSVLQRFFSFPISAPFFLTGGTALAGFYFGHRTSVDLDLFTLSPLPRDDLYSLMTTIAKSEGGEFALQTEAPTIVTGFIKTPDVSLKVDLVQDVPIHVGDFNVVDAIRIDALENIGSNKITASYGRLDPKDFVDLYWILEIDQSLQFDDLLATAKKKDIGITDFHLGHIFVNLPTDLAFPETTPPINPDAVRQFFKTLGERLIARSEKPKFG